MRLAHLIFYISNIFIRMTEVIALLARNAMFGNTVAVLEFRKTMPRKTTFILSAMTASEKRKKPTSQKSHL